MTDDGGNAGEQGVDGLRRRIRALRSAMAREALADLGRATCDRFLAAFSNPESISGWTVMSYRPLASELNITPVNEALLRLGVSLSFPRTTGLEPGVMQAIQTDGSTCWVRSSFGVEEPKEGGVQDPAEIDLILVPGLAFGLKGERIGFGAGHYDRFLPRAPKALKVALALDEQILDSIPQRSWDQRVDWVVTPTREIRLPGVKQWSYHHSHAIQE